MTKKKALKILIQAGSNDIVGSGLGYKSTSDEWRLEVSNAIRRLYKDAYGIDPNMYTDFNLRLTS